MANTAQLGSARRRVLAFGTALAVAIATAAYVRARPPGAVSGAWSAAAAAPGVRVLRDLNAARTDGDINASRAHYERVAAAIAGAGNTRLAAFVDLSLGELLVRQGEHERALALLARAASVYLATTGQSRHRVAALAALGRARAASGDHPGAAAALGEAVTTCELLGPPGRESAAALRVEQADAYAAFDRSRAAALYRRALAELPADHLARAAADERLGELARDAGELDDAAAHMERAARLRATALGAHDLEVARTRHLLAYVRAAQDRCDLAEPILDDVLAAREAALGDDHLAVAETLQSMAVCARAARRDARAVTLLRRSLAIRQAKGSPPAVVAATKFDLARAMWAAGDERPRAVGLAGQARRQLEASARAGEHDAELLDRVDRWLASRVGR